MTGSVNRAWVKTQWLGLIFFIPLFVHFYLKSSEIKEYWTWELLSCAIVLWAFTYFTGATWKRIQERYVSTMVNKIMNYHSICMTSLINEDYTNVKFILNNCLEKYDPKSPLTFFIRGALYVGTKDYRPFKEMKKQIDSIKV